MLACVPNWNGFVFNVKLDCMMILGILACKIKFFRQVLVYLLAIAVHLRDWDFRSFSVVRMIEIYRIGGLFSLF